MSPSPCTTKEAARKAGITRACLQNWIRDGKIVPPPPTLFGAVGVRLWTASDVSRLKKIRQEIYGKGRGRKPKPKP